VQCKARKIELRFDQCNDWIEGENSNWIANFVDMIHIN